jgi:hypothetical protein
MQLGRAERLRVEPLDRPAERRHVQAFENGHRVAANGTVARYPRSLIVSSDRRARETLVRSLVWAPFGTSLSAL